MIRLLKRLRNKLLVHFCPIEKPDRKKLGKAGEAIACKYLKRLGYVIIARNYSTRIGEIDIIAKDGDTLVFVEVKTRRSDAYGRPEEAINAKKKRKLSRLAQLYIKNKNLYNKKARFDVVAILIGNDPAFKNGFGKRSIRLIKNAFYVKE